MHRAHGVQLVFDARVTELLGDRRAKCAPCAWPTVGSIRRAASSWAWGSIRTIPWRSAAGLQCDRGIIVDDYSRTSDPLIVAAGDCCARRLRGRHAAAARVGAERRRAGHVGRGLVARPRAAVHGVAVVLVRSVRCQAADGGLERRVRSGRHARRYGEAGVLGVLLSRRQADRRGLTEPDTRPHGGAQAPRSRPVADAGTGGRPEVSTCTGCWPPKTRRGSGALTGARAGTRCRGNPAPRRRA